MGKKRKVYKGKGLPKGLEQSRKKFINDHLKRAKRKGREKCYLYLVKYENDRKQVFYKIGVSEYPKQRIRRKSHSVEFLGAVHLRMADAFVKETAILRIIYSNGYNYCPSPNFSGRSECFNKKGYIAALDFLKSDGVNLITELSKITPVKKEDLEKKLTSICYDYCRKQPDVEEITFRFSREEFYNEHDDCIDYKFDYTLNIEEKIA